MLNHPPMKGTTVIHVTISISDEGGLSKRDIRVLEALAGLEPAIVELADPTTGEKTEPTPPDTKPAPARTRARAAAKPVEPDTEEVADEPEADEPEADAEEDVLGTDGPTMQDAVNRASELLHTGKTAEVKAALAALGAKRVSELKPAQIAPFIESLDA